MAAGSGKLKTLLTSPLWQGEFLGQRPGESWRSKLKSWFFCASLFLLVWFLLSWMSGENIPWKTMCQCFCGRSAVQLHSAGSDFFSTKNLISPSFRGVFWADSVSSPTFWETVVTYLDKAWKSHQPQSSSPGFKGLRCAWEAHQKQHLNFQIKTWELLQSDLSDFHAAHFK